MTLWGLIALTQACKTITTRSEVDAYPTMVVENSDKTLSTTYSATIRGRQDIAIYSQVSGKITDVRVTEGQYVRQGQVMFVVDQIPYQAELRVAEANYIAAQVGVESAKLDYDSAKQLYDNQVVSSFELQSALNSLHTAEAALAQSEALRINARNNLSYTEIKSPSNGVVGTLPFREGTLVSAAMTEPLTTVSDNSEAYVYFSINENTLLDMAREYGTLENALLRMPDVNLSLSDGSIYAHTGRIAAISGIINESTGTASLRAVFPNPDGLLRSGANGNVVIPENYTDIILIPQEATYDLQDKVFVYKVIDGIAQASQIVVSAVSDGREYIVLDGLAEGDEIVSSGAGLLRNGVRVKNAAEGAASAEAKGLVRNDGDDASGGQYVGVIKAATYE